MKVFVAYVGVQVDSHLEGGIYPQFLDRQLRVGLLIALIGLVESQCRLALDLFLVTLDQEFDLVAVDAEGDILLLSAHEAL